MHVYLVFCLGLDLSTAIGGEFASSMMIFQKKNMVIFIPKPHSSSNIFWKFVPVFKHV